MTDSSSSPVPCARTARTTHYTRSRRNANRTIFFFRFVFGLKFN